MRASKMDNKEKLKKVIEQDINPNDCYNKMDQCQ